MRKLCGLSKRRWDGCVAHRKSGRFPDSGESNSSRGVTREGADAACARQRERFARLLRKGRGRHKETHRTVPEILERRPPAPLRWSRSRRIRTEPAIGSGLPCVPPPDRKESLAAFPCRRISPAALCRKQNRFGGCAPSLLPGKRQAYFRFFCQSR